MQDVTHATGAVLVQALSAAGALISAWIPKQGPLWYSQTGVAVDAHGDFYATDSDSNRQRNRAVWEYTRSGRLLHSWGDRGDRTGHFYSPQGVAIGPADSIYVADTGNHRVQVLVPPS